MSIDQATSRSTHTVVAVAGGDDQAEWDGYASRHAEGTIYHRWAWDRVFRVYRLPVKRLVARRGSRIVGILPLVWQHNPLLENQLVSLPWFDSGGLIYDDDSVREQLFEAAQELALRCRGAQLNLRQMHPLPGANQVRTDKVLMRLALEPDEDALWKRLSAKVRNQVRKAEKSGLTARSGGAELIDEFHRVYSINMRDLGSPAHSRRFFVELMAAFSNEARLHIVEHEGEVIGAGLTLANKSVLEIPWASSLKKYNPLCVNHCLYWHVLRHACRQGFAFFHFGRSGRDSGTYHFKAQWGAEPWQLYWYYFGKEEDTARQLQPLQERLRLPAQIWRHLPLALTRLVGPKLIAKLP